jgi:uncharacterized tellurite resistance protein B-like protein
LDKGSQPGNAAAAITGLILLVILLLAVPQVVLILFGLLTLVGLVIYVFGKSKDSSLSISNPQVEQKSSPALKRTAKPPPPPPPPLQQTTSSSHLQTPVINDAQERREVASFSADILSESKLFPAEPLLDERPSAPKSPEAPKTRQPLTPKTVAPSSLLPKQDNPDDPVSVVHAQPPASATFRVPRAPQGHGKGLWVPFEESITIRNTTIPGGMIYVGSSLEGDNGINDPCLIDPTKPVAQQGDYTERQMGYWPSYSDISSSARRAYLNWLSDGRRDPAADIGFVFIFFYGLERRAIVDALSDETAQADLPIIAAELRRLLAIYGGKSNSFYGYASEFLDWITLPSYPSQLYEQPLPELSKSFQLPLHLRLALGQAAMDGKPVPPNLALGWAKLERNITLRTPATRCPEEFDQLFLGKYSELFNQGIILPRNKTRLRLVYRPASAGFRAKDALIKVLDDIPDITVLSAPIKKIQEVVEAATKDLEPFSRLIAKNPASRNTYEGLLRLPASIWPEIPQKKLFQLKERVGDGILTMKYKDALRALFEETSAGRDIIVPLARILESICVGIEPNVLIGAKPPKLDDHIVLFAMPSSEVPTLSDAPFLVAELTLQLASAVAAADGDFSLGETDHLREQVSSWSHLTKGQKRRLLAHIELLSYAPASLTPLKKKIDRFDIGDREMIAESMARVAHVDGDVSPDAIGVLEKIYKVLGVSTSKVFSDLHSAASGSEASKLQVTGTAEQERRFSLNRERIAARQADTEKVQVLLAKIFSVSEEHESDVLEDAPPPEPPPNEESTGLLLGLDSAHSTLIWRMLARHEWSREDLLQMAAELDLMLDGALEHINDAAFDSFEMPLIESDDPIVLNAEVLGMLIT